MPGRDGKGPQGSGAGTGARRGSCFAGSVDPHGKGRGRVFGADRRPGFGNLSPEDMEVVHALEKRVAFLERELEEVRRRLDVYAWKQD